MPSLFFDVFAFQYRLLWPRKLLFVFLRPKSRENHDFSVAGENVWALEGIIPVSAPTDATSIALITCIPAPDLLLSIFDQ
jgi:hypothetical protein